MFIKFNSVELTNFGSVGHAEFSLSPGIFHVKGINEDNDGSESNGSGKSTVFSESFRWILYGSTSKRLASDGVVNDKIGKDCKGVLNATITDDSGEDSEVTVTRYRNHSTHDNSITLEIDTRDETRHKSADTQAEIERVFRLPINVFSSVYLMEQGLESKFTSMSNVESKSYIESLRNVKVWDTAWFKASATLKKKNEELAKVVSITQQNSAVVNSKTKEIFSLGESIAEANKSLKEEAVEVKIAESTQTYKNGLIKLTSDKSLIDVKILAIKPLEESNLALSKTYSADNAQVNLTRSTLNAIKSKLGSLTCSECKRDFDNKEEAEAHINSEIKRLSSELETQEKSLAVSSKAYTDKDTELKSCKRTVDTDKASYNTHRDQLITLSSGIQALSSRENILNDRIETLKKSQERLTIDVIRIKEDNSKAQESEKVLSTDIPYYKELLNIFSFKGIRSYLITNDLEFLNEKLREFSTYMFSDMIIQFFPNLNKEGMVVSIDTLALLSSGVERVYKKLSGGERRRADICIQLSIREFVRRIYNVDTNLFSLDEIFDGLDSEGIYNVMELINEVSNPNTTIFVISFQTVQHASGGTITVIKHNGVSKIAD